MVRKVALLVAATLTLGLLIPTSAEAAGSSYGVSVSLPSAKTSYNHAKVYVAPSVHVRSGVHKSISKRTVLAYQGSHRLAAGTKVALRVGTYQLRTRVTYRGYHNVTRHRSVKVYHPGDMPDGTRCKVLAANDTDSDGTLDTLTTAVCSNTAFPGQSVKVTGDDVWELWQPEYTIGETIITDYVSFHSYYTYKSQPYRARVWDAYHTFTTKKHKLVVKDGGHRRTYSYSESHNTPFFTVPTHWTATYSFDCSNFGTSGNWIVDMHRKGSSILDDKNLRNQIRYRGTGGWHFTSAGTYQFQVITECDWTFVIRWR